MYKCTEAGHFWLTRSGDTHSGWVGDLTCLHGPIMQGEKTPKGCTPVEHSTRAWPEPHLSRWW